MKQWLLAAAVFAMMLPGVGAQQKVVPEDGSCLFPCPGPIVEANPAVRHEVVVHVPTRVVWRRVGGAMAFHAEGFVATKVSVGEKMATGSRVLTRSYPASEQARADADEMEFMQSMGLSGGLGARVGVDDGKIQLGKVPTVVEVMVELFETDVPPQHMWMPEGKKYKVIWRKSFRQVVP